MILSEEVAIAGQAIATFAIQAQGGGYCREYTAQATVAGRPQQTYSTACRQPDGSWHIVN